MPLPQIGAAATNVGTAIAARFSIAEESSENAEDCSEDALLAIRRTMRVLEEMREAEHADEDAMSENDEEECSSLQSSEHPSPEFAFPSSHSSCMRSKFTATPFHIMWLSTLPSPHLGQRQPAFQVIPATAGMQVKEFSGQEQAPPGVPGGTLSDPLSHSSPRNPCTVPSPQNAERAEERADDIVEEATEDDFEEEMEEEDLEENIEEESDEDSTVEEDDDEDDEDEEQLEEDELEEELLELDEEGLDDLDELEDTEDEMLEEGDELETELEAELETELDAELGRELELEEGAELDLAELF